MKKSYQELKKVAHLHYNDAAYCTVIAVAAACEVSFGKAQAALARAGRKHRQGATMAQMQAAMVELGYCMVQHPVKAKTPLTLLKNGELDDSRTAVVEVQKHVSVIRQGEWVDHEKTQRKRIWQVGLVHRLPTNERMEEA